MKFTTLLTIIITGYVIYYAYQIIHDLFFTKGVLSDELHIEEEVDITGEVEKYQPVKAAHRGRGGHHGRGREIPACQSQQG